MSETLKFGNGIWAVKEGSTLAFNDENGNFKPLPFTFDRSTSATRVNKDGLIEVVSNNEPRIDFLNDSKGALKLEPTRSNLITYSENLNGTGWNVFGGSGGTCTRTLNYGISPDGTQNSTRAVFSDGNTALYFTISISVASTATIYVKGVAGEVIGFGFGGSVADGSDFTFNGEWQRLVFSGSSGGSVTINTWAASRNARDFEIYGVQLEQGSYATSYIPTQGSIGTRVAESCSDAGNDQVINSTEGVLYIETSALSNDLSERRFGLSDGTSSNVIRVGYTSISNRIIAVIYNGSNQAVMTYTSSDITQNSKIAVKYKENDFALWVDGVERSTDTFGSVFSANTLNSLDFNIGGGSHFYSKTKDVRVYNTALTDAELAALTS